MSLNVVKNIFTLFPMFVDLDKFQTDKLHKELFSCAGKKKETSRLI